MKQPIEPKPTTYQSQRFRSRLEARWAVFFDHIPNILSWRYEPTTIKFKNGWTYTPDFLLVLYIDGKRQQLYIECKPSKVTNDYQNFLQKISRETEHGILLVIANMYDDTEIHGKLFVNGSPYPCKISKLFGQHIDRAYERASTYRFDLR